MRGNFLLGLLDPSEFNRVIQEKGIEMNLAQESWFDKEKVSHCYFGYLANMRDASWNVYAQQMEIHGVNIYEVCAETAIKMYKAEVKDFKYYIDASNAELIVDDPLERATKKAQQNKMVKDFGEDEEKLPSIDDEYYTD